MTSRSTYKNADFRPRKRLENTPVFQSASSGKEKDSETGYYYFGARYYNPDLSLWLSVDPMSDKYPSLSPYNYCALNPMKLVDPDGCEPWYNLITGYNKNIIPNAPTAAREHPVYGNIRPHHGMDMKFEKGARVNSAASGKVYFAGVKNGYGNTVVIDHGEGYYTLYAHLNSINVNTGDDIKNGDKLGEVGNTGVGTGPHLHVEYIKTSKDINIFGGNKNSCRFNPMDVDDLQNIVDNRESQIVTFLDGHSERIGSFSGVHQSGAYFYETPKPKPSERLRESKMPIVQTLGDILNSFGL